MIWFGMIVKVIVGMLMGGSAEDTRSDDEADVEGTASGVDEDEKNSRPMDVTDLNVCVGGSDGDVNKNMVTLSPKPRATTTRRRLMDAENRKELLGRIGCEKP